MSHRVRIGLVIRRTPRSGEGGTSDTPSCRDGGGEFAKNINILS